MCKEQTALLCWWATTQAEEGRAVCPSQPRSRMKGQKAREYTGTLSSNSTDKNTAVQGKLRIYMLNVGPTKTTSKFTTKAVFLPLLTVLCWENTGCWSAGGGRVGISAPQTPTWSCGAKGTWVNSHAAGYWFVLKDLWRSFVWDYSKRMKGTFLQVIGTFGWLLRHKEDIFTVKWEEGPRTSGLKLCSCTLGRRLT